MWWVLGKPSEEEKEELPPPAVRHPLALLAALENAVSSLNLPPLSELRAGVEETRVMLWAARESVLLPPPGAAQMSEVVAVVARHLTEWFTRVHPHPADLTGDLLVGQGIVRVALALIGMLDRSRLFEQRVLASHLLVREGALSLSDGRRLIASQLVEWPCEEDALTKRRLQSVEQELGALPAAELVALRRGWISLLDVACESPDEEQSVLWEAIAAQASETPEDCHHAMTRLFECGHPPLGYLDTYFTVSKALGRLEEARDRLTAIGASEPFEQWIRRTDSHALAERHLREEDPRAALGFLEREDDSLSAHLLRGRCFEALDSPRRAKVSYDRALELAPQSTSALAGFARVELAQEQPANALSAMRAAFQLGHAVGSDALLIAGAAVHEGLLVEAHGWLEVAREHLGDVPPVVAARVHLGQTFFEHALTAADPTEAQGLLETAASLAPGLKAAIRLEGLQSPTHLNEAVAELEYTEARAIAELALTKVDQHTDLDWLSELAHFLVEHHGGQPWSLHLLAKVSFKSGRTDDALTACSAALQMPAIEDPAEAALIEQLSVLQIHIHRQVGDLDASYFALSVALNRLGMMESLVEEAAEALRSCTSEEGIAQWQQMLLSFLGPERYRELVSALEKLRDPAPKAVPAAALHHFLEEVLARADTFELSPRQRSNRAFTSLFSSDELKVARGKGTVIRAAEKMGTREPNEAWRHVSLPKASDAFKDRGES